MKNDILNQKLTTTTTVKQRTRKGNLNATIFSVDKGAKM